MPLFGQLVQAGRRWRLLLVSVAIASLGIHLADRFHVSLAVASAVQSNSPEVQHMDQDACPWVPPAVSLSLPSLMIPNPRVAPAERGYPPPHVHHCLYDRPPPGSV
jgi:hypothetical protein